MSGTSADGIDAALVAARYDGSRLQKVRLVSFLLAPYPRKVRTLILDACAGGSSETLCRLNALLGEMFAEAAARVVKKAGLKLAHVDAIGSHGQTVQHRPVPEAVGPYRLCSTFQIGEPAVIAERTGVATVAGFRARDMAAGGQGAPLAPYFHYLVFRNTSRHLAVHNFGGINNVTLIPAGSDPGLIRAFDTGPGNMLIDGVVQIATAGRRLFDAGGSLAAAGRVDEAMVRRWLRDPYLDAPPPKSTGRERYGAAYVRRFTDAGRRRGLNARDLVATATALVAAATADQYARFILPTVPVEEIVGGGGGWRNRTLVERLRRHLPVRVRFSGWEDYGLDGKAVEAMAFAVFALETLRGNAVSLPGVTGARRARVLGHVTPG